MGDEAAAATSSEGGLVFPSDSVWDTDHPQKWLVSLKKTVFVRQCYVELYALCQHAWNANVQGVFLKGTPGVGKSYFLDYVMSNLVRAGKKVLLLSGPSDRAWLCSGFDESADTCSLKAALTNRWANGSDYVLFDPHEDPRKTQDLYLGSFCDKKFLIAMSPDPMNCAKIVKDAELTETIYMGPTTMEESENMRICCYSSMVKPEQLQQRFDRGGGIPRFLFKSSGVLPRAGNIDAAVASIDERLAFALNDLVQNSRRIDAGSVASEFKSLWSLYHLVPDSYYTSYSIELCSEYGHQLLLRRLLEKDVHDLWNLYDQTNEKYGTLRGIRFEAYAHKKILADGINGMARLLTTQAISSTKRKRVVIPAGSTRVDLPDNNLHSLATHAAAVNTSSPAGRYLLPRLPDFPVIDSAFIGPPDVRVMLQMKAGKSKPLSEKAVTICDALGNFFVVVVPADNVIGKKLIGGPTRMEQYVFILNEMTYL